MRRDTQQKEILDLNSLGQRVREILKNIQKNLFQQTLDFQRENTRFVQSWEDFKETIESKRGFIKAYWCGNASCEERIKEETMATIRVIPLEQNNKEDSKGGCILCQRKAETLVYFARAY